MMTAIREAIDAYIIARDETRHYRIDESDQPTIRQIRGVYLFDRNEQVHCCELTPSYDLIHLYDEVILTEEGEALGDDARERLFEKYGYCGGDDCYVHCRTIDAMIRRNEPFTVYHYGGTGVGYDEADHDEQLEAIREHCCCNHLI